MEKKIVTLKNGIGNGLISSISPSPWFRGELKSLSLRNDENHTLSLKSLDSNVIVETSIESFTPHLFPLSHLVKPIRVEGYLEGKEFVPMVELAKVATKLNDLNESIGFEDDFWIEEDSIGFFFTKRFFEWNLSFHKKHGFKINRIENQTEYIDNCLNQKDLWKLLNQWHFNTEDLNPSEFIDASESKVYEPK